MAKRDSWWDEAVISVVGAGIGAGVGQFLEQHPVIGAVVGATAGVLLAAVIRKRYIRPLAECEERLSQALDRATVAERELAHAHAAKPALVVEKIQGLEVDVGRTLWFVVVRNDGESATFTAKYAVCSDAPVPSAMPGEHIAAWGRLTSLCPPLDQVEIAKGDRGEVRLAMTVEEHDPPNYPAGTVTRSVHVLGSNGVDPIQTYSHKAVVGITAKAPPCVVRLSIYATPSMEGGPLRRFFLVGVDGVRQPDLDVSMRRLLLESRAPHERVRNARDWFAEIVLAAKAGDGEAKDLVPAAAELFLNVSRAYGASGPLFEADYQMIRQAHEDLLMQCPPPP